MKKYMSYYFYVHNMTRVSSVYLNVTEIDPKASYITEKQPFCLKSCHGPVTLVSVYLCYICSGFCGVFSSVAVILLICFPGAPPCFPVPGICCGLYRASSIACPPCCLKHSGPPSLLLRDTISTFIYDIMSVFDR